MSRRVVLFALLTALLWQSVAMARIGSSVNVLTDAAHAALHWQAEGHHHHADGSYHLGHSGDAVDSAEAALHLLSEHSSVTTALLAASAPGFLASGAAPPAGAPEVSWPDHLLDGLLRPPRART